MLRDNGKSMDLHKVMEETMARLGLTDEDLVNSPSADVLVNGQAILTEDVDELTWQGNYTYEGMTGAKQWTIKMFDGTVYQVDPKTLDDQSFQSLLAVHFPD